MTMLNRRTLLGFSATALAFPRFAIASPVQPLPPTIILLLRGAMDGLNSVVPYADPAYAQARAALAMPVGGSDGARKLDGLFALHPALTHMHQLFNAKQALFVHAVATDYRERSHFDAQDVLERGMLKQASDGWLNRALLARNADTSAALAMAPTLPLLLRGNYKAGNYAPSRLPEAPDDLLRRVSMMYERDSLLHPLWEQAVRTDMVANSGDPMMRPGGQGRTAGKAAGDLVAKLMTAQGGPTVVVADSNGWDTHAQQGTLQGRLAQQLAGLDAFVESLRTGLGAKWQQAALLVLTEFGRTVAVNGTGGTDHGTGSVAMLLGGAVKGGRMLADWPGLAPAQLHAGRDLKPTAATTSLCAALLRDHWQMDEAAIATALPGARAMDGLFT
jgi:uncharacterized protein (DUF1501 family)